MTSPIGAAATLGRSDHSDIGARAGDSSLGRGEIYVVAEAPAVENADAKTQKISAFGAAVRSENTATNFQLDLTRGVTVEVFTLANPYRVVIDLPEVEFKLPVGTGKFGEGLITAFRYGLFAENSARIVIDTRGPVQINAADMNYLPDNVGVRLSVRLQATDKKTFGKGTGANRNRDLADANDSEVSAKEKPKKGGKPVVVIDPGHGGIDSGARGANDLFEKTIALDVGKKLKTLLGKKGRYVVHMTRNKDIFVSLDRRIAKSREVGAVLFLSLHADSIAETEFAQRVSGARVYTLSEKASDEQARLMAEKENKSDVMAGLVQEARHTVQEVRDILIDLMKRETANFSTDMSNALVQKMKGSIRMSPAPQRSAAFKVLKQTGTPSVLIELGFLSNAKDEKLMSESEWQYKAAQSIAAAVDLYFSHRKTQSP